MDCIPVDGRPIDYPTQSGTQVDTVTRHAGCCVFYQIRSKVSILFFSFLPHHIACGILGSTAAAKSDQSCLTLCYPVDGNPLGSSVPGIIQARILEWVAISFQGPNLQWKSEVLTFGSPGRSPEVLWKPSHTFQSLPGNRPPYHLLLNIKQ